jgi:hypothetical protein
MKAKRLEFACAYLSESGFFNELWPIQIRNFRFRVQVVKTYRTPPPTVRAPSDKALCADLTE